MMQDWLPGLLLLWLFSLLVTAGIFYEKGLKQQSRKKRIEWNRQRILELQQEIHQLGGDL